MMYLWMMLACINDKVIEVEVNNWCDAALGGPAGELAGPITNQNWLPMM